jgi:processive 1,2-diacylglycerol beta-glucosyltransferase
MKLLILTCNTGQGHNSCANALQEAAISRGMNCEVKDALAFISDGFSKVISKGHVWIYRHFPWLFSQGYKMAEQLKNFGTDGTVVYRLLSTGVNRMAQYLEEGQYDYVLCTHVFASTILTEAMKKCSRQPVTGFVATDYTCHPSCEQSDLDLYFIPHEDLKEQFTAKNISEDKLVVAGIPVRQMFFLRQDQGEAKRSFGIEPGNDHLLMMCGSMGCGPMEKLAEGLAENLSRDREITVVCGTNAKLQEKLAQRFAQQPRVHILGYVKDMSVLLDSADLYMTKPGGISTSEAAAKGLPMVLVDAVAGCEEHNANFFVGIGGAILGKDPEELVTSCLELIQSPARRRQMARACRAAYPGNPAEEILDKLEEVKEQKLCAKA